MPKKIIHAHDNFIKQLLSGKEYAVSFLKDYLPDPLVKVIDFRTLTPQDTSYVSKDLKATFSDLVWGVQTRDKKKLGISLLLEHKSYPDSGTAFQLLEYLASGYRKQMKERKKVEPIIPILYYHGKKGWNFKNLEDYFSEYPQTIQPYLPAFATEFINLQKVSPEQILALTHSLLISAVLYQKYYFDPESLKTHFKRILENLLPYWGRNEAYSLFVYILQNPYLEVGFIEESIKNLSDDMGTKMMSAYDQLMQKGRELGLSQGKELGVAEGLQKGIAEGVKRTVIQTILNAFDNGVNLATIRAITGETEEKINDILKQNKRIR